MNTFAQFLAGIQNPQHRALTDEVLQWVTEQFPDLVPEVKWNNPMFTDHGTYIIGFSVAKPHLAVSPEAAGIRQFASEIVKAGCEHTDNLFRMRWEQPVPYALLHRIIAFNIADKADCQTFWR